MSGHSRPPRWLRPGVQDQGRPLRDRRAPPKPRRRSPRLTNPLRARHPGCARLGNRAHRGTPPHALNRRAGEPTLAAKIRVHELAKELGLTNKETLDLALDLGIGVKTH
ncbi:MAG: translation initiation factor IF-2 N-terminal domain-containing protein, partial [Acidimicrobiales bacterium]